jgi:heat shock protein HslJ
MFMKNSIIKTGKFLPAVLLALLLLKACSPTAKMTTRNLLPGTTWELSEIRGVKANAADYMKGLPYLVFDATGGLKGSTGCNQMTGVYTLSETGFGITPGAMTRMACPGEGEQHFLSALSGCRSMKAEKNKLTLLSGQEVLLTFVPKK